jgi:hypothetical protein
MKHNKQSSSSSIFSRKNLKALFVAGLIAGIVFMVWGYVNYTSSQQFSKHAATASGKVTKLYQQDQVNKPLKYYITYNFTVNGGSTYTNTDSVSPYFWQAEPVGSSVSVVYNSQSPRTSYISGYQPTTMKSKRLILVGAVIFLLSFVVLLFLVILH